MRAEPEFGSVITGVAFDLGHLDPGFGQREARFDLLGGLGVAAKLADPFVEPLLHVFALLERAYFIAHHAFEIVGKTASGKEVWKAGGEVGIGSRRRVVI